MQNLLKVERAKKEITQEILAQAVGVSRQTIISIESGKYIPSTILALKLARYFNTSVEAIFTLDPND
ncbi:MAG: helix-turn-helix transcriptional regulator [Taibaiella sp.]|nr:helix-turn-helix transcriptional regulator [Taibaiella sp.]